MKLLKKYIALSAVLACAMTLSPINVLADDGGYTVQYFESEADYFNQTGNAGGSAGVNVNHLQGQTNGYITTTGDYAPDYMGTSFGSDVISVTEEPKVELWSREPLASQFAVNKFQGKHKIRPVKIVINGRICTPQDTPAIVIDGRVFVPLRFVAEQMGYSVSWDEETLTAEINDGAIKVEVGSYTMWKYDAITIPTNTPPFFYEGTLMVGLRQIGNALNFNVKWDAVKKIAYLERATPSNHLQQHNVFNTSK